MPKKNLVPDSESESEPEVTFEVELIRRARVTDDETWEYFIKWGGYPEDENSWEPESNLTGCRRMLTSFWEQVGPNLKTMATQFPVGHEVEPSSLWIKRERRAYRKSAEKKKTRKKAIQDDESEGDDNDEHAVSKSRSPEVSKQIHEESSSDTSDVSLSMKVRNKAMDEVASDATSTTNKKSGLKRKRSEEQATDEYKKRRIENVTRPGAVTSSSELVSIDSHANNRNQESKRFPSISASISSTTDSNAPPPASKSSVSTLPSKPTPPTETLRNKTIGRPIEQPPDKSIVQPTEPPRNKPAAQPTSSFPSSTSNKPIPAHLQRKLNPRVKPMALPMLQTGGPVGISTKARISGAGIGTVVSRSAQPASQPSPAVGTRPSGTTSNSFALNSPVTPQSSTSAGFDASRWLQENIITTDLESAPPPQISRKNTSQNLDLESAPPPQISRTNTSQNLHFSKRWRWTGQLAVGDNESDSEAAFAEPVGGIVLTENTTIDRSTSDLGIELLIPSHIDSLCLRHSYSLAALLPILADFRISHFARMSADESKGNSFSDLVAYMTKCELFSLTPLFIGDRNAATMFVFPACFQCLWDQLSVPPKTRQGHDLLVAIGFQIYEPTRGPLGEIWKTYSPDWNVSGKLDVLSESKPFDCSRALHALVFPDPLFKRIAHKECAVFTTAADKESPGPDTVALDRILRNTPGCKIVTVLDGDARIIFIHVAAWGLLHRLVGLVDRRRRRQDVQFYTYGSDPTVEPKHWGVHEVFPIGGVVTFTPRAIIEDPEGVEKLINKLDEHPLWTCYIIPSVLAMIVDVVKSDNGSNSKIIDALCGILVPIEKGQIALTWQPPSHRAWHKETPSDTDPTPKRVSWMIDQAHLSELRGHELVVECQKRLQRSPHRSEKDVESSMVMDMLAMQSELRQMYRRFVIITDSTGASNISREAASSRSASKADIKDGFEFTHVDEFAFGDDYPFDES